MFLSSDLDESCEEGLHNGHVEDGGGGDGQREEFRIPAHSGSALWLAGLLLDPNPHSGCRSGSRRQKRQKDDGCLKLKLSWKSKVPTDFKYNKILNKVDLNPDLT